MIGKVVHFEIPFDDKARASAFYEKAFGWQLSGVPEMDYTIVKTVQSDDNGMPKEPGAINGGMLSRQAPIMQPVITIAVDDMDGALARIVELGGAVVRAKMPVGDMGFAAYFTDSEGNLMGLWQLRH